METSMAPFPASSQAQVSSVALTQSVAYPKWLGGSASCLAVLVSHPLDLMKVRLQTSTGGSKPGILTTVGDIFRTQGPRGFYNGLSAGLLRQLTYGSTRFALYEGIKEKAIPPGDSNLAILMAASAVSGAAAGLVGNPADIANVRMQNDRSLASRNVFSTLASVGRESGIRGYYRGVGPNCTRAAVMTSCQLGAYDGFKAMLTGSLGMAEGGVTQLLASVLAGLMATTLCSPLDVVKTQLMSSAGGERRSVLGIVRMLTMTEGMRWVFRGWVPSFVRLGPHTAATMMLLEQQRKLYRRYCTQ